MVNLDSDIEVYYKKCGEIFMELKENSFSFSCTICGTTLKDLDVFIKHLYDELDNKQNIENFGQETDDYDRPEPLHSVLLCAELEENLEQVQNQSLSEEYSLEPIQTMFIVDVEEKTDMVMENDTVEPIQKSSKVVNTSRKRVSSSTYNNQEPADGVVVNSKNKNIEPANKTRKHAAESSYTCDICDKVFARREYLRQHSYTHSAEKPFECDFCVARFADRTNLVRHKRKHTGERPYPCEICSCRFKSSSSLKVHLRRHTGDRPYICEICGRSFITAGQLKDHHSRHLNLRKYACETCDKAFTTSSEKYDHIKSIHNSVTRDKECNICGATFKTSSVLRKHKQLHTGKNFLCIVCGKGFAQNSGLYLHMKAHDIVKESVSLDNN